MRQEEQAPEVELIALDKIDLVKVFAEDTRTGNIKLANEAFFTFVSLDDNGVPCLVPTLKINTDSERTLFDEAQIRRTNRLNRKNSTK